VAVRPPLTVCLVDMSWPGYQSLGLGYVRAYAQEDRRLKGRVGFTTLALSSTDDPWWVAYQVLELQPDVVGFAVTCWNARAVYDTCGIIARARCEATIVLGGPEVGPIAEDILRDFDCVDIVVRGEGEETFSDVLDAILRERPIWKVEGVSARRESRVVSADDRAPIAHLDSLPSPYLTGVLTPHQGSAYIESYRGCPHSCGYCYEGKGVARVRSFGMERVAAEVEHLVTVHGLTQFSFIDPVFNLTSGRLEEIIAIVEPYALRGVRLHTIEVDIERIDHASADLLRRAGVVSVETGPQTIGTSALAACKRAFDPERFSAGVQACVSQGIRVECDLIVGLPGDTTEDFLAGLDFALKQDPGTIQFSTLHVLPGTDLWERAREYGLVFNPAPPHEIIATRDMSFGDLRRAEILGTALTRHYRARIASEGGTSA